MYRVRPYEKVSGSANLLYEKWNEICKLSLRSYSPKRFKKNITKMVEEFDSLETVRQHKPKVGLVGEILVKYHPTANNDIVSLVEAEGAEAVVPDLIDFLLYSLLGLSLNIGTWRGGESKLWVEERSLGLLSFTAALPRKCWQKAGALHHLNSFRNWLEMPPS